MTFFERNPPSTRLLESLMLTFSWEETWTSQAETGRWWPWDKDPPTLTCTRNLSTSSMTMAWSRWWWNRQDKATHSASSSQTAHTFWPSSLKALSTIHGVCHRSMGPLPKSTVQQSQESSEVSSHVHHAGLELDMCLWTCLEKQSLWTSQRLYKIIDGLIKLKPCNSN